MVDGSVAIQELESRIRYRITEDGGDLSKLSTGYTNLQAEYTKAKDMWEKRTRSVEEDKKRLKAAVDAVRAVKDGVEEERARDGSRAVALDEGVDTGRPSPNGAG